MCEGERRIWVRPVEGKLRRKSNITLALNVPRRRQLSPHPISNVDTQLLPFQCIHHTLPYHTRKFHGYFWTISTPPPPTIFLMLTQNSPSNTLSSASPSFQDFLFWKIQFSICVDIQYRPNPIHYKIIEIIWIFEWQFICLKNHIWKATPIKVLVSTEYHYLVSEAEAQNGKWHQSTW